MELALAAVDEEDVREGSAFVFQAFEPSVNHFANRGKVVDSVHRFDFVALIAGFERQAVDELNQRRDGGFALEVRDIDALNDARGLGETENFLKAQQTAFRIHLKDFRLDVALQIAAVVEVRKGRKLVPDGGGLLEVEVFGGLLHFVLHFLNELVPFAVQKALEVVNLVAVIFARDPITAGGRALADGGEEAGTKKTPFRIVIANFVLAGPETEDFLEDDQRAANGAGERAVELDARGKRLAGGLNAREGFVRADLKVGKGLAVLKLTVELRLNVLDQPRFHEECVHFAQRLNEINVANFLNQKTGPIVDLGLMEEVAPCPLAEILGFADVNDALMGVFHQVNAGNVREGFDLFRCVRIIVRILNRFFGHDLNFL